MEKEDALESLPNIGKAIAEKMRKAGVKGRKDFLKRDPYDVFDRMRKEVDPNLCRCALASVVGAKQGKVWHKITKRTAKEYERRHPRHKWGKC